ncbi:gamma-aminobutyric acid type B receptor subunit 1-like [Asterias rubens]|uniref:gamma-aminobutyric acid type B receptor subunit 1-like n=1 Tax=Asterias rubens TaxID=7604 RepID=UPI001455CF37|nr:gamma-aminobutyric acid type B receptor subunit 1-like [Asterias rubens]
MTTNLWVALLSVIVVISLLPVQGVRTPLYIGGLLPLSGGSSREFGRTSFVGSKRAVEDINNRSDVLADYELVLEWADTEQNVPSALNRLFEFLYTPPVKVAIYGPLMSSMTTVLAEVVGQWNLVEISPGASAPILTDHERYPHVYRMVVSSAAFGSAQAQIVSQFGWKRIATLHEATEPHRGRINQLREESALFNFSIIIGESFLTDPYEAMVLLKERDVRIIATSFYENMARRVFCVVSVKLMFYKFITVK